MSTTDQPAVSRGLLITLGIVGGLAALAALYIFVVSPLLGGEETSFSESLPPAPVPEASDVPSEAPTFEPAPVPETVEVFNARDPFQQLVLAGDGSGAGSAPPAAAGPGGEAPPGSTGTPPGPPGSAQVGGTTVELREVITDADGQPAVVVVVNGTVHEANEGDTFAERFRVLDIDGDCATFLFGDSRFTLCEGDTIRK